MSRFESLRDDLREVRARYDALKRGRTAPIRHCKTADDLVIEPMYWRVGGALAHQRRDLAHVVILFPLATQERSSGDTFSLGRLLHRRLGDRDGAKLRFRRLLASADRDELDHRLRGILRLACADGTPVEWGALGLDILSFFHESNRVRRSWAQDFYAPLAPNRFRPGSSLDLIRRIPP